MDVSRTASRVLLGATVLAASLAGAVTADAQEVAAPWPAAGDAWPAAMRLGHRSEPPPAAASDPARTSRASQCRKWRSMAAHLGESFAGYTLRSSVLRRVCDGPGEAADESWDWPWVGLKQGRLLPPRLQQTAGAWQIRCGFAGARQRCAAVHVAAVSGGSPAPPDERPGELVAQTIIAHFVIDTIAGRESVLWRLYVASEPGAGAGVRADANVGETGGVRVASAGPMRADRRSVTYVLGDALHEERFSACSERGCIMEAGPARASQVATALWDGAAVPASVTLASGGTVEVVLPGQGFRQALRELVRLRRDEARGARR